MATKAVDRIFVDTNILTRATIVTAPLHEKARAVLEKLWEDGAELWISRQVVREYIANVTRPQTYSQPLPAASVIAQVQRFQAQFKIADDEAQVTVQLLRLLNTIPVGGKQIHDTNIVATMLVIGIPTLFTHNINDFARFSSYITLLPLTNVP